MDMQEQRLMSDVEGGARDLMDRARIHSPDPIAQAAVLLATATSLIERTMGATAAPAALALLLQPTWTDWSAAAGPAH